MIDREICYFNAKCGNNDCLDCWDKLMEIQKIVNLIKLMGELK